MILGPQYVCCGMSHLHFSEELVVEGKIQTAKIQCVVLSCLLFHTVVHLAVGHSSTVVIYHDRLLFGSLNYVKHCTMMKSQAKKK